VPTSLPRFTPPTPDGRCLSHISPLPHLGLWAADADADGQQQQQPAAWPAAALSALCHDAKSSNCAVKEVLFSFAVSVVEDFFL